MAEHNPVVEEWISKAEADWAMAQIASAAAEPRLRDGVVYHAQQCVEKLLKARLIQLSQPIRRTHDLAALSESLQQADVSWPLEWTGRRRVCFESNCFLPATQGQR